MRYLFLLLAIASITVICIYGCSKGGNNYIITDHTVGMTSNRNWTGYAYGKILGDTEVSSVHMPWPKGYYRSVTDTPFAIIKINGFRLNVLGVILNFRSVDSVTTFVRYDSTYPNSATSFLVWDFGKDTMHFEYHNISGFNSDANAYYEDNWVLRSTH